MVGKTKRLACFDCTDFLVPNIISSKLEVKTISCQILRSSTSKSAMSCPCGLTKAEVVDLDQRDRVPLVGGKCQNPLADGSEGICGKALGAHPLAQGNYILFDIMLLFNHFLISLDDFML
jgi:hypothetical protein